MNQRNLILTVVLVVIVSTLSVIGIHTLEEGGGNSSPFASFTFSPKNPAMVDNIAFDASESGDPDGSIENYFWRFGDGTTAFGENATHVYPSVGNYRVTLTVIDNSGLIGKENEMVRVATSSEPFVQDYETKTAPTLISGGESPPISSGTPINVNVYPDNVSHSVLPTLMGNNVAVWTGDSYLLDSTLKSRLSAVNTSILRFPGGSTSDTYHWNENYPPYAVSQEWDVMSDPWAVDTAEFCQLAQDIGTIPLIAVNYGYHQYFSTKNNGDVQKAAKLAASWVEYCNAPNDGSNPNGGVDWAAERAADGYSEPFDIKYWEIGNETYGSWEVGYEPRGEDYGRNFNEIYEAMKDVDPAIYVGMPAGWGSNLKWTKDALSVPGVGERVDFLDPHNYFHWMGQDNQYDISRTKLLDLDGQIRDIKEDLDEAVAQATSRSVGDIKYYLGEYNLTNPSNYHNVQLVNGLFISEVLGELISNNFHAASLWDVANGWDDGTHGFLSQDTPDVPDYIPLPSYYPFYFYTRNFGNKFVRSSCLRPDVQVYASKFSSGELGLVIVNESESNKTANINFHGFTTSGGINEWILSGNGLKDMDNLKVNGVSNEYGFGGPIISSVTPYYRHVGSTSSIFVNLKGYSVTSLVIY